MCHCGGHGNLWALLQFRISSGDTVLKEHLDTAPMNATYISPDIQNQVIQVLGDYILHQILINKETKYFSVIAGEVTDSSNKEQLAVVLCYVNPSDRCIREDLVTVVVVLQDRLLQRCC